MKTKKPNHSHYKNHPGLLDHNYWDAELCHATALSLEMTIKEVQRNALCFAAGIARNTGDRYKPELGIQDQIANAIMKAVKECTM